MSADKRTSEQIRREFFEFFQERDHELVESASIVPQNDPTLLFTNAGMNQFKDVFLGTGTRPYDRAVDTQKCLRVSGKHNDLDEVGYDTYHHTFFEMLGNWSFGDYFKEEAIGWAWELLVDVWGLDPDRLYATVHAGDEELHLDADEEAAGYWESETDIAPDHILYEPSRENFWMMGDTGPCGPCSEVHVDLRPEAERRKTPGRELVNADTRNVIEIWNLVFIQYNAQTDGSLERLDAEHVDTGMGFERIVAVLQNRSGSTYDTDLFAPLLARVAELSPRTEIRGYDDLAAADRERDSDEEDSRDTEGEADECSSPAEEERERIRVAMRVVVDHVRAIAFAVADGVSPGNEGRGYVIRRILRRAVRYGYSVLGFQEPFLYRLLDPLREKMSDSFPELDRHADYIESVVRSEEEGFLETLDAGISFFERVVPYVHRVEAGELSEEGLRAELGEDRKTWDLLKNAYVDAEIDAVPERFAATAADGELPGEVAFLLHDTYGFPIDLTLVMAREEAIGIAMERYEELMQRQRERARAASTFAVDQSRTDSWEVVSEGPDSEFAGYEETEIDHARIRAVRTLDADEAPGGDGAPDAGEKAGDATGENGRAQVVLDRTPFYAEAGGQVGDTGTLRVGEEEVRVLDTQTQDRTIVHIVDRLPQDPTAEVLARVDPDRRREIRKQHSATHLLHAALRRHLGTHVKQKGSLVAPDRLRFDFSHFEALTDEELRTVERQVDAWIQENIPRREERDVPMEEALDRGAMALFGEKYGGRVRVITFDPEISVELCGGTHVEASGELGFFRITSESSVASGVRRIEAVAGEAAVAHVQKELGLLERVRGRVSGEKDVDALVGELIEREKELEKELERVREAQKAGQLDRIAEKAATIGAVRLAAGTVPDADSDMLQSLGQTLRTRLGEAAVGVLGSPHPEQGKVYLVVSVSDDLVEAGWKAGELAGEIAREVGGGGGGRPTLATAGGREPEKLEEALAKAEELVAKRQEEGGS